MPRVGCGDVKAYVSFNFTGAHQIAALMEVALVLVVVGIMIGMTQDLGSVLTLMMVRPLEKMFGVIMSQAQHLMDICAQVSSDSEDDEQPTELETIDTWLLQKESKRREC